MAILPVSKTMTSRYHHQIQQRCEPQHLQRHQLPTDASSNHRKGTQRSLWMTLLVIVFAGLLGPIIISWSTFPIAPIAKTKEAPEHPLRPLRKSLQGQQIRPGNATATTATKPTNASGTLIVSYSSTNYHIVFSTGCSVWQDWQSYVFFYHVHKSGQMGNVTRIVSGCSPDEEIALRQLHQKQIQTISPHFGLHFTPDYSSTVKPNVTYVYFNKPFGMKHWMEQALGYNSNGGGSKNNLHDDTIIILLDPDQIILRPFLQDYSKVPLMGWNIRFRSATINISMTVQHGSPLAQYYAFGGHWLKKVNLEHILGEDDGRNRSDSPLYDVNRRDAYLYAAGPPYIATARDMYKIVSQWADFAPRVHDNYPELLAEMFAFCLAAVHVNLHPQTAAGLMISDPHPFEMVEEGWYFLDRARRIIDPHLTDDEIWQRQYSLDMLPFVLHYCQPYAIGPWFISKRRLCMDLLSCEAPLLEEPPRDLLKYDYGQRPDVELSGGNRTDLSDMKIRIRQAWMVTNLIRALNEAFVYYKRHNCNNNGTTVIATTTNYSKVLRIL